MVFHDRPPVATQSHRCHCCPLPNLQLCTSSTRPTGPTTVRAAHRVRLCYRDEAYRQRTEVRTKNLIADASLPTSSSTSALLAKKALKYRKVYDRMTGVDVNDPNFDVFEFLGVDWCKSSSMETSGRFFSCPGGAPKNLSAPDAEKVPYISDWQSGLQWRPPTLSTSELAPLMSQATLHSHTAMTPITSSVATSSTSSTRPTGPTTVRAAHRVRLCYRDEAYRQRTEVRTKNLIADASLPTSSSTSALLAKKALKYRKVYDRMTGVDVNDPNFDVFEFLGVDWCKSSSMETSGHV
ncbi:hypothetical protein GQ600_19662 [Phytophthora cactorum]|nr:hypothetical protein GQ600_19662 [Phytophthora cactorum]